jgi:chaperonin cofactor prefoldin
MEELQASMQQMLKNFGEMRVEVKTVTTEVQGLRQQL